MKKVLHQKKKEVFGQWLHHYLQRTGKKYIWPQICYDFQTASPIHLVFEKNRRNAPFIQWPILGFTCLSATHIDFTGEVPILETGKAWDYVSWHQSALNGGLLHPGGNRHVPKSFWQWRDLTVPQGNLACDLDGLFKDQTGCFIGIEATEIYHVTENVDIEKDVFEHFKRLFILRHGRTGGFNIRQLKAQKSLVDQLDGRLFMLFHRILKCDGNGAQRRICGERVLLLEITEKTLPAIETMIESNRLSESLKRKITFHKLESIFDRLF